MEDLKGVAKNGRKHIELVPHIIDYSVKEGDSQDALLNPSLQRA